MTRRMRTSSSTTRIAGVRSLGSGNGERRDADTPMVLPSCRSSRTRANHTGLHRPSQAIAADISVASASIATPGCRKGSRAVGGGAIAGQGNNEPRLETGARTGRGHIRLPEGRASSTGPMAGLLERGRIFQASRPAKSSSPGCFPGTNPAVPSYNNIYTIGLPEGGYAKDMHPRVCRAHCRARRRFRSGGRYAEALLRLRRQRRPSRRVIGAKRPAVHTGSMRRADEARAAGKAVRDTAGGGGSDVALRGGQEHGRHPPSPDSVQLLTAIRHTQHLLETERDLEAEQAAAVLDANGEGHGVSTALGYVEY